VERCQRGHIRAAALQAALEHCAPSLPTPHGASPQPPPLLVGQSSVAQGAASMSCTPLGGFGPAGASHAVGREFTTWPSLPKAVVPILGWAGESDADGDAESPLATAAPRVGAPRVVKRSGKSPCGLGPSYEPPDSDGNHSTGAQAQAVAAENPSCGGAGKQVAEGSPSGASLS
jgi:hypothetical protein